MEVLPACPPSPSKVAVAPSDASYTHHPSSPPRATLLDRRARGSELLDSILRLSSLTPASPVKRSTQALSLLYGAHSPGREESYSNAAHASPSVVMSPATATGTVRAPRKAPSGVLPFVPLTPIMASPRLTPGASSEALDLMGAGVRLSREIALKDAARPGPDAGGVGAGAGADMNTDGYPTRGARAVSASLRHSSSTNTISASSSAYQVHAQAPPRWTSTPPTPPPKVAASAPPFSEAGPSSPSASPRKAKTSRSGRRAVSVAVFPDRSRPGSSPPSRTRLRPARSADAAAHPQRRHSLPPNLSKPLPPVPTPPRTRTGSPLWVSTVPKSESVPTSRLAAESLGVPRAAMEADRSAVHKRLFRIGDGERDADGSDREEERVGRGSSVESQSGEGGVHGSGLEEAPCADVLEASATEPDRAAERVRAGTRRYHALLELLTTEVGYLMDLRALVLVYLEQLHTLSTSALPHTPSALSLPGLGLGRSMPSSRSSYLHAASPQPSPSPSATSQLGSDPGHGAADERDAEREKARLHASWAGPCANAPEPEPHRRYASDEPPPTHARGKHARHLLFPEKEVQAVCRNAAALLAFHERFVEELQAAADPVGFGGVFASGRLEAQGEGEGEGEGEAAMGRIDEAVSAITEKFVALAPSFEIYETFCPGHTEAADLVRTVQESFPTEWDAYEQRCALLVAHAFDLVGSPVLAPAAAPLPTTAPSSYRNPVGLGALLPEPPPSAPVSASFFGTPKQQRRHSTSSLSVPEASVPAVSAVHTDPPPPRAHARHGSGSVSNGGRGPRLKFLDYLIKPVQRICKYPLLLDQLRRGHGEGEAEEPAGRAGDAMRRVVGRVDRASEAQARVVRSLAVAARMAHAQGAPERPEKQGLTAEFVASLGPCALVGALDVVRHPSALHAPGGGALRAKYLAAFLYAGGYLVLAKVAKGGRVYEPRHWLALGGFDVLDWDEEDGALPFSFHLCGHGHHLQLAAACQHEKAIWTAAIQEALAAPPRSWVNEPPSSLQADDRQPVSAAATDEGTVEWSMPLATIQSLSELEAQGGSGGDQPAPALEAPASPTKARAGRAHRMDSMALRQEQLTLGALNRRASAASVKAFFSSPSALDATRVARPSAQVRQQVEQGLQDVFSENCMAARSQALLREEELFYGRKKAAAGMSRSNSGLSITGAMGLAARRRYDSVVVSRRKSSVGMPDASGEMLTTIGRGKSVASKCRKRTLPSIIPVASNLTKVDSDAELELPATQSPVELLDSPSPLSQCSSATSSNAGSALPSPICGSLPLPTPTIGQDATIRQSDVLNMHEDYRPKRTRSMVDNVRYFFQSRPASPSSSSGHSSPTPHLVSLTPSEQHALEPPVSIVQWWRGSLRRRVQSSPDVPGDEPQAISSGRSSEDSRGTFLMKRRPISAIETPLGATAEAPDGDGGPPSRFRRVAFTGTIPTRRRSLLVPSTSLRDTGPGASPSPRKPLKTMLFFQRSNSLTPVDAA